MTSPEPCEDPPKNRRRVSTAAGTELKFAVELLLQDPAWSSPERQARVRDVIKADFDEYFEETPEGFRRRFWRDPRHLMITWETQPTS